MTPSGIESATLTARSAVPQPTAPPCAPSSFSSSSKNQHSPTEKKDIAKRYVAFFFVKPGDTENAGGERW